MSGERAKNPDWIAYGQRLTKAMKHADLNALQLAKRTGVDDGNIGRMCRGERGPPRASTAQKLADACGVRGEWLTAAREPMVEGQGPSVDQAVQDGLEEALASRWWDPLPVPPPDLAAQVIEEVTSARNKGAANLTATYWAEYMRARLRQLTRPDKTVEGTTVQFTDDDNPLATLGGGLASTPKRTKKRG